MMVDYLKLAIPDPFGFLITGGEVSKVTHDGEIEWSTRCKREMRGSWSSKCMVRTLESSRIVAGVDWDGVLELDGNPAKFLEGHNLFGSDDPVELARRMVQRVGSVVAPGTDLSAVSVEDGMLSRIDLTGSWLVDRDSDVLPFLRAMEERVWCPYRGRGVQDHPGTLYYGISRKGKRAKDWQLKLYAKGLDIVAHPLPEPALTVPGLLEEVNRTIRVELTLRSAELKRLGLQRVGDWTPDRVETVWRSYVDRLDFSEATMSLDVVDLAGIGLKARHIDAIAAWKAGNDLRAGRSRATFHRLRKEVRDLTGYDIATHVPKSNVVPLRRVVEAKPASTPSWADELTAALRVA